jgi:Kef-type K+ transport system membrane component KefB
MHLNTILSLGIIFITAFIAIRLIGFVRLPMVTAYLILGICIGPCALNLITKPILNLSGIFSEIVLGVIAFLIGENFSTTNFKRLGKSVLLISLCEVFMAWVFVVLSFRFLLGKPLYLSILFGAIATATAPAATIMVVREYKTKGIFTNTLLGVVAIDDAWGLILFTISLSIARGIYYATNVSFFTTLGFALLKLIASIGLGVIAGWFLSLCARFAKTREHTLILTIAFILLGVGVAKVFNLSALLANMFLGVTVTNISPVGRRFFDSLRDIDAPLYLIFFVLVGANLELGALKLLGIVGCTYFFARIFGKALGASLGAIFARAPHSVRKYIGFGLLPQAGVALGLAMYAKSSFPEVGGMILTTIIGTTVLYEIIGPPFTKFALSRAGEITEKIRP